MLKGGGLLLTCADIKQYANVLYLVIKYNLDDI
jgi:hypothetical protein